MRFGESAPWPLIRWQMAQEMGWSLEYIDSLDLADVVEWLAVRTGIAKAQK